jgi:5'-deoxynucleotidase YfbR-like HD superfamily hydrolase
VTDYILTALRDDQDRRGKIRTYTGRYVNPLALTVEDIHIDDVAHHLAGVNRYTGATSIPFNVAHHSVLVTYLLADESPRLQLAALLHDASEAYLNDIASPVKHDPRMAFYREAEAAAMATIFTRFGLLDLLPEISKGGRVKAADDATFHREAKSFFGGSDEITPWSASTAELMFLDLYWKLLPETPNV